MNYLFDVDHAKKYGVAEAIIINNFQFWLLKNKANGKNYNDGRYWTYNSKRAMSSLFPFWTEKQISRILKSLLDQKVIITGKYNKTAYDHTLWYAFYDETIFLNGVIDTPKRGNQKAEMGEPIPDINTYNKPDYKLKEKREKQVFQKPSFEQIKNYFTEFNETEQAEEFYDHYEANGWLIGGKSKMKDWEATARNWIRRSKKFNFKNKKTNTLKKQKNIEPFDEKKNMKFKRWDKLTEEEHFQWGSRAYYETGRNNIAKCNNKTVWWED